MNKKRLRSSVVQEHTSMTDSVVNEVRVEFRNKEVVATHPSSLLVVSKIKLNYKIK